MSIIKKVKILKIIKNFIKSKRTTLKDIEENNVETKGNFGNYTNIVNKISGIDHAKL